MTCTRLCLYIHCYCNVLPACAHCCRRRMFKSVSTVAILVLSYSLKINWTDCSFFTLHGSFSHKQRKGCTYTQKAMGGRHRACWWPVSARSALHGGVRRVGGTFVVLPRGHGRFGARTGSFAHLFSGGGGTPPASGWGLEITIPRFCVY